MVQKKLDGRVRTLIERGVARGQRSMLCLVGDRGKDQIPNLHRILSRASVRARPRVLWCYKKDLGFSTHRKKRLRKLKAKKAKGGLAGVDQQNYDDNDTDPFEAFVGTTEVDWCYYRDTHRLVLGQTYGLLVLQDFEALTPNLMARTVETVEGGGLVVFLMRTVASLKQMYAMSMDVHARYRASGDDAADVVPRFNERFLLSLGRCRSCLVCDDELNVLPLSGQALRSLETEVEGSGMNVDNREPEADPALLELKRSLEDVPHVGCLVGLAKTTDQARALVTVLEACSDRDGSGGTSLNSPMTVALTAARGRGKSAVLGLCLAGAVSLGYSTIGVTAPDPENLVAVFDFLRRGLIALKYQEHLDFTVHYDASRKGRETVRTVLSIDIHYNGGEESTSYRNRQSVTYHPPEDAARAFATADLVACDEAAAIPLPLVKALVDPVPSHGNGAAVFQPRDDRVTLLSSTIHGYEGTGRSLSLKLLAELRSRSQVASVRAAEAAADSVVASAGEKKSEAKIHERRWEAAAASQISASQQSSSLLKEVELTEPIRYRAGDPIEAWLNKLLCLGVDGDDESGGTGTHKKDKTRGTAPAPGDCDLFRVDRDALFSFHDLSERFLQNLMSLYTTAHYKNSPNDLQLLSDAPAHGLYVLLAPQPSDSKQLPEVLAVIQTCLEGRVGRRTVEAQLARGHRAAGDLVPWTLSQQYGDPGFAGLSGARIVRVAVPPHLQRMGYGTRAMELLVKYFEGELMVDPTGDDGEEEDEEGDDEEEEEENEEEEETNNRKKGLHHEVLKPRVGLPPLLHPLTGEQPPVLDWLGTSFGLTESLHRFWTNSPTNMTTLYVRQTPNELTGEHSAILVRALKAFGGRYDTSWVRAYSGDFRRRLVQLLGGPFRRSVGVRLAVALLSEDEAGKFNNDNDGDGDGDGDNNENGDDAATKREIQSRAGRATNSTGDDEPSDISASELRTVLTPHDLRRLQLYSKNLCDHHLVTDLLAPVARLYFCGRLSVELSGLQAAVLCGMGLQHKTVDDLCAELTTSTSSSGGKDTKNFPANQALAIFHKSMRKLTSALHAIVEAEVAKEVDQASGNAKAKTALVASRVADLSSKTLEEDMREDGEPNEGKRTKHTDPTTTTKARPTKLAPVEGSLPSEIAEDPELMSFAVRGTDEQWEKALQTKNVDGNGPAVAPETVQLAVTTTTATPAQSTKKRARADGESSTVTKTLESLEPSKSKKKKSKRSNKKHSSKRS